MTLDLKKLQNGSDIRGIAIDGIEGETPNLTPDAAEKISRGFLRWLTEKTGKSPDEIRIAVGRDSRLSGPALAETVISSFTASGAHVLDTGLSSTPAMFMSCIFPETACDGAVMITASHLPFNRNGFKYFTAEGGLDKSDIAAILTYAGENTSADSEVKGTSETSDLMALYSSHLRNLICKETGSARPLEGLKICVDAGNGAGGFYARDVLAPLGADVSSSQFLEPDGTFPNHQPNPENKEAMKSISAKVTESGCDFGIIFDTDVDRSAAVDSTGRQIARNGIVAMASSLVCEEHPGTTVVTDSVTSDHLTAFLEDTLSMKHLRYKRGYRNVINKAVELNKEGEECWLAIETSGHAALKENYFLDDGAYLATKIVIKAALLKKQGKTIDSIISGLKEPAESEEIRFPITAENFAEYGDNVLSSFSSWAESIPEFEVVKPNYEGVRVSFDGGWCLLRKSLHDPIMPLNIESDTPGGAEKMLDQIRGFLKDFDGIDTGR